MLRRHLRRIRRDSRVSFFRLNPWLLTTDAVDLVHRPVAFLSVLPVYDVYPGFVINSAWAISAFDEIRNARMRW